MKNLGIYVHIPFCQKKCDYCDFISFENKTEYISSYIQSLINDIESFRNLIKDEYIVDTIYFGGRNSFFY